MAILNFKITKAVLTVIFSALVLLGIFLGTSISFADNQKAVLPPPAFVNPEDFHSVEEVLYLEGRANPNASVTVAVQKPGENSLQLTAQALDSGEWIIAKKIILGSGIYEIRAQQQLGNLVSGWSEPQIMKSIVTGIHILGLNILYINIVLALLIILVPLAAIFSYFVRHHWKFRIWVKNGKPHHPIFSRAKIKK
ncbi:MAG: hypothetical protein Q7S73_02735 [bacterium]|nr:hypothetical protein [bacterium]